MWPFKSKKQPETSLEIVENVPYPEGDYRQSIEDKLSDLLIIVKRIDQRYYKQRARGFDNEGGGEGEEPSEPRILRGI